MMKGTLVNSAAVLVGAGAGLLLRRGFAERYQKTVMQGLGLAVGLVGLEMALKTENMLIVILSLATGGLLGEWVDIDRRLNSFGGWLSEKSKGGYGDLGQGFVAATLIFCVGAMAVVGSIQDGLTGDAATLYAKAMLDGISSVILASAMGAGVALSSVSILLYQGTITLLAGQISSLLGPAVIREMTAVGGILIIGISLLMLEIKTIKVANLLPAILAAAILATFWH
ncbi:MAG: DUF554 domain-containing protein [Sporomusaceae bacterium]|nr:DUF554 domain-containing protein [Sporomusaceae bacterium]